MKTILISSFLILLVGAVLLAGIFILSACTAAQGAALPQPAGTATELPAVTITDTDAGKIVNLALGQTLVVKLDGNLTTGYTWEAATVENPVLEQIGEPESQADSDLLGAPGKIVLVFKATQLGQQKLSLIYHQPFDKDTAPEKTFDITVIVGDQASAQPTLPPTDAAVRP